MVLGRASIGLVLRIVLPEACGENLSFGDEDEIHEQDTLGPTKGGPTSQLRSHWARKLLRHGRTGTALPYSCHKTPRIRGRAPRRA